MSAGYLDQTSQGASFLLARQLYQQLAPDAKIFYSLGSLGTFLDLFKYSDIRYLKIPYE